MNFNLVASELFDFNKTKIKSETKIFKSIKKMSNVVVSEKKLNKKGNKTKQTKTEIKETPTNLHC